MLVHLPNTATAAFTLTERSLNITMCAEYVDLSKHVCDKQS
jgi:hypothetical protein